MATLRGFLSLFTGAGGLDWGFHARGLELLGANDRKPDAGNTYALNYGALVRRGGALSPGFYTVDDVSLTFPALPGSPLVLLGGPPCQDFSVLRGVEWERTGLRSLRGRLYLQYARYLALTHPLAFVFENVPGLLSSNGGSDIQTILEDLEHLDQLPIRWKEDHRNFPDRTPPPPSDLLKAKSFPSYPFREVQVVDLSRHGLPQKRKRLFIIGFRKDLPISIEHMLYLSQELKGSPALARYPLTALEAIEGQVLTELNPVYQELLQEWKEFPGVLPSGNVLDAYLKLHGGAPNDPLLEKALEEHALILKQMGWLGVSLSEAPPTQFADGSHQRDKENRRVMKRLRSIPPGSNHEAVRGTELEVKGRGFSLVYRRLHPLQPSYTVVAHGGGGTWGYHYRRDLGKLTNRERARLQGFPDGFLFSGIPSQIRAQIGEAVPPLFSLKLATLILELIGPLATP